MKLINNTRAAVAILIATAMIFSSILLEPLQASAADGSPTNVSVTSVGDVATISWVAPTVGTVDGYEYQLLATFLPVFIPSGQIASTYYVHETILPLSAAVTSVDVRLPAGGWSARVRAVSGGEVPVYSDWAAFPTSFQASVPTPTLTGNYQRIYQTEHLEYIPSISGISTEYSLVYAVGDKVLKATKLDSILGLGITWQELSTGLESSTGNTVPECSLSTTSVIEVYAVYLSAQETSAVAGCDQTALTLQLTERKVAVTQFGFSIEPIPTASATFDIKQPPATAPVLKTIRWLDNETPTWSSTLTLVGGGANSTAVEFVRWNNADGTPADASNPPILGATYTAVWTVFSPLVPLEIQVAGQNFSRATIQEKNYLTWSDNDSTGRLLFSVNVLSGTNWNASLTPIDFDGVPLDAEDYMHHVGGNTSANGSFGIDHFCTGLMEAPLCPNLFRVEFRTYAPAPTTEDPSATDNKFHYFYLIRDSSAVKPALTYQLDDSADPTRLVFNDADPRWMQLVAPPEPWNTNTNKYFVDWCPSANASNGVDCLGLGSYVPVVEDLILYPRWIENFEPESIWIGSQEFTDLDWKFDPVERAIYLKVQSSAGIPFSGGIEIDAQRGLYYNTVDNFSVLRLDGNADVVYPNDFGEFIFAPGCGGGCPKIYFMSGAIEINGIVVVGGFKIFLIAAPDLEAKFGVTFDATPGALPALDREFIAPRLNQPVGWYTVPVVLDRGPGFENNEGWEFTDRIGYWESFFPVVAGGTLALDWLWGPLVTVPTQVTFQRGDSLVATATAAPQHEYEDLSWDLIGPNADDFDISGNGEITMENSQLSVGSYTFSVVAEGFWMEGPPVQMTVTVVERSQVDNSQNTNLPPTNQTGAGQHLPKPGSKLQPDLISKVSRSKLAVGGTAQFGVTGGEPGAKQFFESKNTRVCSINSRGLVTAKSTGVCLISATATALDPVFAVASAPLAKIVVLGEGLINNAKVTELKGQVSIKASLLKSLAGKSVKLAIQVKRGGKLVLVPMRSEVLSKSATATFKSFKKPRPGTRVVLTIGGRAVYALTL